MLDIFMRKTADMCALIWHTWPYTIHEYICIIYLPNSNICNERVSVSFSIPNVIFWLQKSMSSTTSKVLPSFPTSTQQLTAVHDSLMLQAVVPLILNSDSFVGHSTKCIKIHYKNEFTIIISFLVFNINCTTKDFRTNQVKP